MRNDFDQQSSRLLHGNTILEAIGPPNKIAMGCPTVLICLPPQGVCSCQAAKVGAAFVEKQGANG
jgi:hypothetical protein